MKKTLFTIFLLLTSPVMAQFSTGQDVQISAVSSGHVVGRWVSYRTPVEDEPYAENYAYADVLVGNTFYSNDIPASFFGVKIVHTNESNENSATTGLVSFTTDSRAQICVWWPDSATVESWIATDGYLDIDQDAQLNAEVYSAYCRTQDEGALAFDDSASPMYWVTASTARREVAATTQESPDNGAVRFGASAYEIAENATTDNIVNFKRILSSVGAVSVDVDDSAATTCNTADFDFAIAPTTPTATNPVTGSWADGELGQIFLSIDMADLSAPCLIVFEFESLTGGLAAGSDRQTATITILDTGGTPSSANRFIDTDGGSGSDLNDCTSGTPCLTAERAASVAVPGDTIEFSVSGSTADYTQCINLTSAMSGTSGNEITWQVETGKTVRFYPSASCDEIWRINADYHIFDWTSNGSVIVGDSTEWMQSDSGRGYTHGKGFYIGAEFVTWDGGTIYGGSDSSCNWIQGAGENIDIENGTFRLCGTNNDGPTNDRGDTIQMRGSGTVRIIGNSIFTAGHNAFKMQIPGVVRDNIINQDWSGQSTGAPGQKGGVLCSGCGGDLATAPWGPILWEGNITKNVADSSDGGDNQTMSIAGYEPIIRRNLVCEASADEPDKIRLSSNIISASDQVGRISYYNNTRRNAEGFLSVTQSGASNYTGMTGMDENFVAGNLIKDDSGTNSHLINWASQNFPQQGYPDFWRGSEFRKNWVNATELTVRLGGGASAEWGSVNSEWPNVFDADNDTTAFSFDSYTDDDDCTTTGLALAGGSNGIGEGPNHAEVTSGSSGTSVSVDRARVFWDGEGIPGESGDYIAFYSSAGLGGTFKGIRQVTDVNRATDTLTISSSITLVDGDLIWLVDADGVTVVDNMGAVQ